jgi:hypothetical protein
MSLEKFRELLQSVEYFPASLQLEVDAQAMWESLPGQAKAFCWVAAKKERPGPLTFKEAFGYVWAHDEMTMECLATMSDDEKAEVLGFFTFQIHELTHHFDFLITPFGVNYHGKLFREYRAFQRFAPLLLREAGPPCGRFVDYDPVARGQLPSDEFQAAWREVHDIDATLEALGDGGMPPRTQNVIPGWGDKSKTLVILNQPVDRVTVHGFLYTVVVPNEPGWYLRPSSILETRALLHCLQWILHLLGNDERARELACIYLDSFYGRETIAPDYRFLFDLCAKAWEKDFHTFVREAPIPLLQQFLMMTDAACWYALQAPPPMPDASAIRSSPIIRLIHGLRFLYGAYGNRQSYSTAVDAMLAMDVAKEASAFELTDISRALIYCAEFVHYLRQLNQEEIIDPVFRKHFDRVLGVQQRQLAKRAPKGYISFIGMPENGHPVLGIRSEEDVNDLAWDAYVADPRVREWFAFRQEFLYHSLDAESAGRSLRSFFGENLPRQDPSQTASGS